MSAEKAVSCVMQLANHSEKCVRLKRVDSYLRHHRNMQQQRFKSTDCFIK